MNENIDLTKILKDCPKGWKLYSPLCGEVEFSIIKEFDIYPIIVRSKTININFSKKGYYFLEAEGAECLIFPSKDQRDWSKFSAPWYKNEKFDTKTLKPFDKVIVRNIRSEIWTCGFFSHTVVFDDILKYNVGDVLYVMCIPYNDETKHLIGTTEEAPDYYRY